MQDEILIKYLLGEAAVEEVTLVESWLKDQPVNQKHLLDLRKVWDKSHLLEKDAHYNTEEQWQRLKAKMHTGSAAPRQRESSGKTPKRIYLWRWAAALIIGLLGSWFIFQRYFTGNGSEQLILTATASPLTDTLSDGSIITLNRYSRLQAPLKFTGNTREVSLESGEAFFKVMHHDKKPFLVHAGKVDVKVLGTSFNIKNKTVETFITVATGKVQVTYKGQQMTLNPNERAVINYHEKSFERQSAPSLLYNYYVTRQFIANNTRLEDLVSVLNEAYDVHIVLGSDRVKQLRLTTVFAKQPIDKILQVIAATFHLQILRQGDRIILQ